MSFRDLPKSLIDSVTDVVSKSADQRDRLQKKIVKEGLRSFNVKSVADLTEEQQKALYSWAQKRIAEAACGCDDSDLQEDDMPGDAPFHKGGDEEGEKKKEIDEEDENSLQESIALDADEVATNGAVGVTDVDSQLPVHADVIRDTNTGNHPFQGNVTVYRLFVQFNTNRLPVIVPPPSLPGAPTIDALRDIVEGLPFYCDVCEKALVDAQDIPHERPEHRGVDSVTESYVATPYDKKVLNIIKAALKPKKVEVDDFTDGGGTHLHEYVAEFDTDDEFYSTIYLHCTEQPSRKNPGKMSWVLQRDNGDWPFEPIKSEPYPQGDVTKSLLALKNALKQVDRKSMTGLNESLVLSQTDRLVVASVKRLLKTQDIEVLYNNTEYLVRIPSTTSGEFYHLGITLEPSEKRLGKLNWVVYDQTISDQDPNSDMKLAAPEASLPFDQGDIPLSIRKLQELLSHVSRAVAAGEYASQEPSF